MDKKKSLGIAGFALALIVAVVGVSIVWATYTSNLNINGSGTVKGAKWSVIFENLSAFDSGNSADKTSTATEISGSTPTIVGNTTIETFGVELQTPGDWVSYKFYIHNDGDFPAKIGDGFALPTLSCAPATNSTATQAEADAVCNNLTYTLKYVTSSENVSAEDTFDVDESKQVELKIQYNANATEAQLPKDDIAVTSMNITIPFEQD